MQEDDKLKISRQHNVKPYNQDQMDLFPPSVKSLIDEDHLCNIINDVVDMLDLSALFKKLPREGNPSYHPAMMVKILFYAYAKGLFGSRKIAAALKEDLGFSSFWLPGRSLIFGPSAISARTISKSSRRCSIRLTNSASRWA